MIQFDNETKTFASKPIKLGNYAQWGAMGAAAGWGFHQYEKSKLMKQLREKYPDASVYELEKMAKERLGGAGKNMKRGASLGLGARFVAGRARTANKLIKRNM